MWFQINFKVESMVVAPPTEGSISDIILPNGCDSPLDTFNVEFNVVPKSTSK